MHDRALISMWFCDWFARQLKAQKAHGATVTDADCEQVVNQYFALENPVFPSEKVTGGMWQKARTGVRPFAPDRLARIALAAEKLGFWSQAWREKNSSYPEEGKLNLFILAMLAVDGFSDQKQEKQKFKALHSTLTKRLKGLAECQNEFKFEKLKAQCAEAMAAWAVFADELPPTAGHIGLREDLSASFQDWDTDIRFYHLKPAQTLKWLTLLKFGRGSKRLLQLSWQVWALRFYESFMFDISSAKKHARKTIGGTKLAQ